MGRTACTEPQYLYKGALFFFYKNALFWYSHTYHTNLQPINSAALSDAQVHYIHLALSVGSLETCNMRMVACETVIPLVYVL
jgi:hypothetical protein